MDMSRAIMSGALVAAITAGVQYMTTKSINYAVVGIDGGLMAASVVAADAVALSRFVPPILPPAMVAGGVYGAGQWFIRKDKNIVMNVAVGAAADYLTDTFSG
jgi:hypothetical protein